MCIMHVLCVYRIENNLKYKIKSKGRDTGAKILGNEMSYCSILVVFL